VGGRRAESLWCPDLALAVWPRRGASPSAGSLREAPPGLATVSGRGPMRWQLAHSRAKSWSSFSGHRWRGRLGGPNDEERARGSLDALADRSLLPQPTQLS
jgi:hypothetical protein